MDDRESGQLSDSRTSLYCIQYSLLFFIHHYSPRPPHIALTCLRQSCSCGTPKLNSVCSLLHFRDGSIGGYIPSLMNLTDTLICCYSLGISYLTLNYSSNVACDWSIPDPHLTELGREQASSLPSTYPKLYDHANVILTSPMRRTLETTLLGFPKLVEGGVPLEVLPDL